MNPEVSIIMPSYNCALFVEQSIQSVLNQDFTEWELIIVDDCSTDNSIELIQKFTEDERIRLEFMPNNSGSGKARNKAIELSKGRFIAFLDSDDLWEPTKLTKHLQFIKEQNCALSYTSYKYIDEANCEINKPYRVGPKPIDYHFLLKRTDIGCLTAVYDTNKIGKRYMMSLKRKQDYALWLSILKEGIQAYPYDNILASYRIRKGSATNNKFKLIHLHYLFLRQTQQLNVVKALYYTVSWGYNGIKKFFF